MDIFSSISVKVLLVAFFVAASSTASTSITFEDDQVVFLPSGGGEPVKLAFKGRIYKGGSGIAVDARSKDALAVFIYELVQRSRGTDKAGVLDLWLPDERPSIERMLAVPEMYEKNRAFYLNLRSSKIVGAMVYGKVVIVFVLHDLEGIEPFVKSYPLREESGRYYLTNALTTDFFYSQVLDNLPRYLWGTP